MKNKVLTLAIAIIALFCGNAKAQNVDIQKAKEIGAYYLSVATGAKTPISVDKMELAQQFDNPTLCIPAMYAFNVEGNGFVVVSASETTEPVLAYSPEGNLNPENINPGCQYMLDSYARLISEHQNENAQATAHVKNLWKQIEEKSMSVDLSKAGVLVQTKWDQGENDRPSYNFFCPVVNGDYCYAGCVAVAMAQIIKFWNYPEKGGKQDSNTVTNQNEKWRQLKYKFTVDSNKFVYDSMPNKITPNSEWNNIRAVSKLIYACGLTVNMDYSPEGSGTQSALVPAGLRWFKYHNAIHQTRGSNDAAWVNLLHSEITDHQRPVYYSGYDGTSGGRDAGHAWVVCGESAADGNKFYINWGWGGSANGFFTLAPASSIQPASGYKFNSGHAMVHHIYPKDLSIDENTVYSKNPAYPNPASDYIMIPVDLPNSAILGVFSIDGKMLENIVVPAGTKEYRLNLQSYAPGTYVYRLNGNVYKFAVL